MAVPYRYNHSYYQYIVSVITYLMVLILVTVKWSRMMHIILELIYWSYQMGPNIWHDIKVLISVTPKWTWNMSYQNISEICPTMTVLKYFIHKQIWNLACQIGPEITPEWTWHLSNWMDSHISHSKWVFIWLGTPNWSYLSCKP